MKLFGKDLWDKGTTVSWGKAAFTPFIYRHYNNSTREVYIGDDIGVVLGYSEMEFKPDMNARFSYGSNITLFKLGSEQFEYVETDSIIEKFEDVVVKDALNIHQNIARTNMRLTLNVAAEERFGQIRGTKKQQNHILDLSDYNQEMKSIWNDIAGESEIKLQCAVLPQAGDRNERYLRETELNTNAPADTFILKLPTVRSISAQGTLGKSDSLHFAIRIDNYKRENEYAWVRLFDRDRIGTDDTILFSVPQDQDKDGQPDAPTYQEWNFMRLSRSAAHHSEGDTSNIYHLDIPLSWLDKNSIQQASEFMTNNVELTVELAYFANTNLTGSGEKAKWDSYLFKEDMAEGRDVISVPLDHPLLQ